MSNAYASTLLYPTPLRIPERHLRLVAPPAPSRAHIYRRRRAVALVVGLMLTMALASAANAGVSWAWHQINAPRTSVAMPVSVPVVKQTVTVRQGDSLWSIATAAKPGTDVRPLVADMAKARNNAPLQIGERITVP